MAKVARDKTSSTSTTGLPVVTTSSEILADGSAIELIGSADGESLELLHWDGNQARTRPEIEYGGRLYRPPALHPTLRRAIRLPQGITQYDNSVALFKQVSGLIQHFIGLSATEADQAAIWNFTSWFADRLPCPPPLIVSGSQPALANKLFALCSCFCCRGLRLAELTRSAFASLAVGLRPTLFIMQADLPRQMWSLCNSSNYRGMVVPGKGGSVLDVVCSKGIFVGMDALDSDHPAIHLSLPIESSGLPPLDEREQRRVADDLLPQMLKYRLNRLREFSEARSADGQVNPKSELARNLMLCLPDGPELQPALTSILEAEEPELLDSESQEVKAAIIEVLWTELAGRVREISAGKLADPTNALLLSRGSSLEYSPAEIGWKLRQMGIPRQKNPGCNVVRFTPGIRRRVHQLARAFGLKLPPHANSCIDCGLLQPIDG